MSEAKGCESAKCVSVHESSCSCTVNRRGFLGTTLGCGAYVAMALAAAPVMSRRAFAQVPKGEPELTTPFARVEKLADGVWAVVSVTTGGDYTTVSNGGIVAGKDGVLCIEGFNTPAGGRWINQLAKELTGRWPDYVVLTHLRRPLERAGGGPASGRRAEDHLDGDDARADGSACGAGRRRNRRHGPCEREHQDGAPRRVDARA